MVYPLYTEKRDGFDNEATALLAEIKGFLHVDSIKSVRIIVRYLVEGLTLEEFDKITHNVLADNVTDIVSESLPQGGDMMIMTEFLPGQFDQRADSAAQCIQLVLGINRPTIRSAKIFLFEGIPTRDELFRIEKHLINPVESRKANLEIPKTLLLQTSSQPMPPILDGFQSLAGDELEKFVTMHGLSMDKADLDFCVQYFNKIGRDPSLTELKVIDTYWSDHCRHTTFNSELADIKIEDSRVEKAFDRYLELRKKLGRGDRPVTLMDMATIGTRSLKADGKLPLLDESAEINACTVRTEVNGEDYLVLFKNETHNHPTEIEPFGGAATCIGGAIRDPLSGRAWVYQAMRVTGAADPTAPTEKTMPGKLPQRRICEDAARGYSSYGNQIGLATGIVDEIYHPGYAAKRMEVGAVIGTVPKSQVRRETPADGDVVILLGGKTGRDGCGGATGSSKSHNLASLENCGAEVQKGNAPEERKLQRLFANRDASLLIKRCNDFGAGGVAVAVGELADGLTIELSKVPKKYDGLSATELAISESQERMAVVVEKQDADRFILLAQDENLEATIIATITDEPILRMLYDGSTVLELERSFLDTNGAKRKVNVEISPVNKVEKSDNLDFFTRLEHSISGLNGADKTGLVERFDSTIGTVSAFMPYGGTYQKTPSDVMASYLPNSERATVMSYGFDPFVSEADPYRGAYLAVVDSLCKIVASGAYGKECYLSFQEYFERPSSPKRFGKPTAALLGALSAQLDFEVAAIGGKDSMSGTFEELDVPPTLISFAMSICDGESLVSSEFKNADSDIVVLCPQMDGDIPNKDFLKEVFDTVTELAKSKKIRAAASVGFKGVSATLFKMSLGNKIGFNIINDIDLPIGSFVLEVQKGVLPKNGILLGNTMEDFSCTHNGTTKELEKYLVLYDNVLDNVYPKDHASSKTLPKVQPIEKSWQPAMVNIGIKPTFLIPTFPGTNCELDTAKAIERAGGKAEVFLIKNLTADSVKQSVEEFARLARECNVIVLPGGFSGGDEPDGSGKFITSFLRNSAIAEQISGLLKNRDGLMLGICNGFQALIKLGLVPYGEIVDRIEGAPTLAHNLIGRHQSRMVRTVISQINTPWLARCKVGEVYSVPISHGEGRVVCSDEMFSKLEQNAQIATRYVDLDNMPSNNITFNPNGSVAAIEGITSPCGRVYGKMGHSERMLEKLYKNVPCTKPMPLFESAVDYYR